MENSVELTLDNFQTQLQNWLATQLRQAIQKNKNIQTPPYSMGNSRCPFFTPAELHQKQAYACFDWER
jgi:hypothetical protein